MHHRLKHLHSLTNLITAHSQPSYNYLQKRKHHPPISFAKEMFPYLTEPLYRKTDTKQPFSQGASYNRTLMKPRERSMWGITHTHQLFSPGRRRAMQKLQWLVSSKKPSQSNTYQTPFQMPFKITGCNSNRPPQRQHQELVKIIIQYVSPSSQPKRKTFRTSRSPRADQH